MPQVPLAQLLAFTGRAKPPKIAKRDGFDPSDRVSIDAECGYTARQQVSLFGDRVRARRTFCFFSPPLKNGSSQLITCVWAGGGRHGTLL
jgi:hypothetical protein